MANNNYILDTENKQWLECTDELPTLPNLSNYELYRPKENRKVLVTGGAGYAGSKLVEILLRAGFRVRVIDNGQRSSCDSLLGFVGNENFEFMYGNINDEITLAKSCDGIDIIVHLAAAVGMPITNKFTEYSKLVNVGGTNNLIRVSGQIPIIFASTGSVYGALEEDCTEEIPPKPLSYYGFQKLECESRLLERGNVTCFRYSTAFGMSRQMRLDLLPNELVYLAIKQKTLTIFEADAWRTFIHLQDYCNAILYSIYHWDKFKNQVFNVGDESNNCTKRDLAELIKEKTDCSVFYADTGYIDPDKRNYYCVFDKIKNTGFRCKISLEKGIDELIKGTALLGIGNNRYSDKLL